MKILKHLNWFKFLKTVIVDHFMLLENNIQKYAFSAKLLWNSMHCEKRYTSKFELNIWMPLFAVSRCSRFTVKLSERCRLTAWTQAVRWVSTPEAERISRLCAQTSLRWEEDKHMLQNTNISAYIMRLKSCNIKLSLRLSFDGQALISSGEKYPIFTFVEGHNEEEMSCTSDSVTHIKSKHRPDRIKKKSCLEEFVLLWPVWCSSTSSSFSHVIKTATRTGMSRRDGLFCVSKTWAPPFLLFECFLQAVIFLFFCSCHV